MIMAGGPDGAAATGPRFQWNRGLSLSGFYTYGQNFDNTDGAFVIPSSIFLARASGDRRHSIGATTRTSRLPARRCGICSARIGVSGIVGAAADAFARVPTTTAIWCSTIVPKASAATPLERSASWNTSANFGYSFTLGKKTVTSGGGVQIMGSPAGLTVNPTAAQTTPRYRLNIVGEHQQPLESAGVLGIQRKHPVRTFFLKPNAAKGLRRITFSTNVSF